MHSLIYFNYSSLYLQQVQNLKYFKHKNIFHKILIIYHKLYKWIFFIFIH